MFVCSWSSFGVGGSVYFVSMVQYYVWYGTMGLS